MKIYYFNRMATNIDKKPKNLIEFLFEYDDDYKKRFVQIKGFQLIKINEK